MDIGDKSYDPDAKSSFVAAVLYGSLIGPLGLLVQPLYVPALISEQGFTDLQAGFTASWEMAGFALATILLVFLNSKIRWSRGLFVFSALIVIGSISSTLVADYTVFRFARFIAGFGMGGTVSLSFAMLGLMSNPDRSFGIMVAGAVISGFLLSFIWPYLIDLNGLVAIHLLGVGTGIIGMGVSRFGPGRASDDVKVQGNAIDLSPVLKALSVLSMFAFWLGLMGFWAYLVVIGTEMGVGEGQAARAFNLSYIAGFFGALLPIILGANFGRFPMLSLAIAAAIAPLLLFSFGPKSAAIFLVMNLLFNFGFNLGHPYLLSTMAACDTTGRVVVFAVAAQTLGMALGPAVAGIITNQFGYAAITPYGVLFFMLTLILIAFPSFAQVRKAKSFEIDQ
jgi:predicted MFS family arabinose efflux permease